MSYKANFKTWIKFQEVRSECQKFPEKSGVLLLTFLESFIDSETNWQETPWLKVGEIVLSVEDNTKPSINFPILKGDSSSQEKDKPGWDYFGRGWYFWLNLFSKAYGIVTGKQSRQP